MTAVTGSMHESQTVEVEHRKTNTACRYVNFLHSRIEFKSRLDCQLIQSDFAYNVTIPAKTDNSPARPNPAAAPSPLPARPSRRAGPGRARPPPARRHLPAAELRGEGGPGRGGGGGGSSGGSSECPGRCPGHGGARGPGTPTPPPPALAGARGCSSRTRGLGKSQASGVRDGEVATVGLAGPRNPSRRPEMSFLCCKLCDVCSDPTPCKRKVTPLSVLNFKPTVSPHRIHSDPGQRLPLSLQLSLF
ncbi:collagen alpha-2(I) chain-like [Struthio camelus]|uniref:collagen alpha-2(I) chain-like n=1 Tax=Struthio camelus TaxID=8801 RepID=UPI003603DFCA